jgi:hypothetical protein
MIIRQLFAVVCIALPIQAFAFSCPNNGEPLQTGYTLAQVTQRCGQPSAVNDFTTTRNDSEELVYYKSGLYNANVKITFLVNNSRVTNINIVTNPKQCTNVTSSNSATPSGNTVTTCPPTEQNVNSTGICGRLVQTGSGVDYVRSACGNPSQQRVLQSTSTQVSELTYDAPGPNVLVLENGILTDWKYK